MISFFETDETEIDIIKDLWEKLRKHHQSRSKYFFQDYNNIVFEDRKKELLKKAEQGVLRVDLALNSMNEQVIGYCVSSISNKKGEIDSIYVEKNFRSKGIGDNLMKRSLNWMDTEGVETREVQLSAGNDDAIQFYSHYGFHPKHILLKQR